MSKKKSEEETKVNRLENFKMVKVTRDSIKGADYNPRKITEDAKKKLRKLIKENGMVQPIIVNETTGNVVGGHQRLALMDSELRNQKYELTVAQIKVSKEQEIKLNVALNNTSAQGSWDLDMLETIKVENPELDFQTDLAFNAVDIENMFFDSDVFFPPEKSEDVIDDRPPSVGMGGGNDDFESDDYEEDEVINPSAELEKQASIDKIKEQKKAYREGVNAENEEGTSMQVMDDDYTAKIVFNSEEEKWRFMHSIKKPLGETHIKPAFLYDIQSKKISPTKKRDESDNSIHIVFQTNSEKHDMMKRFRMKPEDTLINPSILEEIENGKIDLTE